MGALASGSTRIRWICEFPVPSHMARLSAVELAALVAGPNGEQLPPARSSVMVRPPVPPGTNPAPHRTLSETRDRN